MINNPVVFYISSFLIIAFALLGIFMKNVIYSLLCAIMVFFSASIIFYNLGSEYNAIIQAAVYGFAVPVIIGISIMFTSGKNCSKKESVISFLTVFFSLLFIMAFVYVIMISNAMIPDSFHLMNIQQFNSYDVLSEFARGIFIDYVLAFELLSILLTIVIAGITLFHKRERRCQWKLKMENEKWKVNKEEIKNV